MFLGSLSELPLLDTHLAYYHYIILEIISQAYKNIGQYFRLVQVEGFLLLILLYLCCNSSVSDFQPDFGMIICLTIPSVDFLHDLEEQLMRESARYLLDVSLNNVVRFFLVDGICRRQAELFV